MEDFLGGPSVLWDSKLDANDLDLCVEQGWGELGGRESEERDVRRTNATVANNPYAIAKSSKTPSCQFCAEKIGEIEFFQNWLSRRCQIGVATGPVILMCAQSGFSASVCNKWRVPGEESDGCHTPNTLVVEES